LHSEPKKLFYKVVWIAAKFNLEFQPSPAANTMADEANRNSSDPPTGRNVAKITKDLINKEKKKKKATDEIEEQLKNYTKLIMANPQLLSQRPFSELRSFATDVLSHPSKYPLAPPDATDSEIDEGDTKLPRASPGLAQKLYSRNLPPPTAQTVLEELPVVLVTKKSRTTIRSDRGSVVQWCFHVVDGDNAMINVRVNTTLTVTASKVAEGTFIRLTRFVPIYYTYELEFSESRERALILVHNFTTIARGIVPNEFQEPVHRKQMAIPQ
jgi:hypothetical protein